jgi:secreted Zn-dependent insulinase-like peptidase
MPTHGPSPTGQHDAREYAYFTLPNKLRVLIISDPTTDKAAAAMDVHVGMSGEPS